MPCLTESDRYNCELHRRRSLDIRSDLTQEEASEAALLDYPAVYSNDAPCVLSNDVSVPPDVDELFRKFNARYAPEFQMRLYILMFDAAKGIGISELQRAYWQGGNKNEFVICIGMKSGDEVEWARAFSWADEQIKEVEAAQWLMHHTKLKWHEFHDWLRWHLADWKRKEFKDFDYISITLPLWQILTILALSIAENAIAIYFILN